MDHDDERTQAECLNSFRLYRPVEQKCGHVTEIHHNNLALEDKHFAVLTQIPCPWCAAEAAGVDAEQIQNALQYHGHMRFWGEIVAFRRTELTLAEWDAVQALDIILAKEGIEDSGPEG